MHSNFQIILLLLAQFLLITYSCEYLGKVILPKVNIFLLFLRVHSSNFKSMMVVGKPNNFINQVNAHLTAGLQMAVWECALLMDL